MPVCKMMPKKNRTCGAAWQQREADGRQVSAGDCTAGAAECVEEAVAACGKRHGGREGAA